jgi:hypothetical protein
MRVRITFCHDSEHVEPVEYAFKILSSELDCDRDIKRAHEVLDQDTDIVISYGREIPSKTCKNQLHIYSDSTFWGLFGKQASLPRHPMYKPALRDLQLEGNDKLEDPFVCPYIGDSTGRSQPVYWENHSKNRCILVCKLDLLASAFFWLSRYEETLIKDRDNFGRILEDRLCCIQENCYSRPLVDEYCEALRQLLNRFDVPIKAKRQPLRVLITHDVDSGIPVTGGLEYFEHGLRWLARALLRERRMRAGLTTCLQWFSVGSGLRPYVHAFDDMMQIDRDYGYTSHFFFMANGTHPIDATYDIFGDYSQKIMHKIKASGGQIGLHLGINSHKCVNQFRQEWSNIRLAFPDLVPASRNHYLFFQTPDTWEKLSEIGCRVDSTLGFSRYMGFRAGTSRPFRPFNVLANRVTELWEYPMTIMDNHLFALQVRSDRERIEQAIRIIDKVFAHGGCLVINWHNVHFFSDYRAMYVAILEHVTNRGQDVRLADTPEPEGALIW